MNAKPNSTELALSEIPHKDLSAFIPDPKAQPVLLNDILSAMGLTGPRIPATELVDHQFDIMSARQFDSAYKEQAHAWFCIGRDVETGELFTTVLGGQAVVDVLDALTHAGLNQPLRVTLRLKAQGRFGRYYILE